MVNFVRSETTGEIGQRIRLRDLKSGGSGSKRGGRDEVLSCQRLSVEHDEESDCWSFRHRRYHGVAANHLKTERHFCATASPAYLTSRAVVSDFVVDVPKLR
jgi:hypothetical protein